MALEIYNCTLQTTHHAKFDFDPTTWVVCENSQFAAVLGVFLSFFCLLRLAYNASEDESSSTYA